ncbi:MAG TPA: BON domain-containing protein [Vicinamibacterales bacterium]|nr:BON domain-containing protein [Vicinamibacterales bacterium]
MAADAATALRLHSTVPHTVQAVVHHGHLTLTGEVNWYFQKIVAHKAVRAIRGVRHVADHIAVKPDTSVRDLHKRINAALFRNASVNAKHINVEIAGTTVRLTGRPPLGFNGKRLSGPRLMRLASPRSTTRSSSSHRTATSARFAERGHHGYEAHATELSRAAHQTASRIRCVVSAGNDTWRRVP